MMLARRKQGEPLLALVLVLTGWIGLRAHAWEHALTGATGELAAAAHNRVQGSRDARSGAGDGRAASPARPDAGSPRVSGALPEAHVIMPAPLPQPAPRFMSPVLPDPLFQPPPNGPQAPQVISTPQSQLQTQPQPVSGNRIGIAGGHQMLWIAATALLPLPPQGLRTVAEPTATPVAMPSRWSADGWLLLRRGDGGISPGPAVGTYGASQAGAVLRYRLVPSDPHRLSAYVRGTAALNGTREQQVALGLAARPLARVPVSAMAELRGQRDAAGNHLRPALALVTELPPQKLPLGFTGEVYVQGGYVGGDYATAFVDGLVRAERPVADLGGFRLRAGAGMWGAKQRGAARLDVGPTASVSFRLTDTASARLAADWRFRVRGESKPDSGPALTLSAGF